MLNHIFNSQTKTVTFAAILLAGSALISRLLGLVRDRILAGRFGAGEDLDIYFAAFRIPDFVYGILIMGGLSAVFLPVFAEYFKKSEEDAWHLVSIILNCFLILLVLFCLILAVLTPWLLKLIVPGFDSEQRNLAISLTRIMFLSPVFFGLSSLFSGILHYFNRFLAYSIVPIFYNLGIIFGILVLVPIFGIKGLAYGVVLGAFLHWVLQIPAARNSGFRYFPIFNFRYPGLLKIFKLMTFRVIGASVYHVNLMVVTAIASTLAAGSIAIFTFADNLQNFSIGIVGASFAMASFPVLSRAWANGFKEEFMGHFSSTFRQILFLSIPISFLTFLLRAQIVRIILGTGNFGWQDTRLTAASLGLFSFGIFAFTLVPFLLRAFFSLQDTKTPAVVGLVYMAVNFVFCLSFVRLLSFPNIFQEFLTNSLKLSGIDDISLLGLPLAVSVSGIFYFVSLLLFLRKKMGDIKLEEIGRSLIKIIIASILMAFAVYLALQLAADFVDMATFKGVFFQVVFAIFIGITIYVLSSRLFHSSELKTIKLSILSQFAKTVDPVRSPTAEKN